MSIGPFDINAGAYGKLDFSDPFGDTTANIAPVVPAAPVAQKPVQGNVGISPITMQGAVSIPAEPQSSFNFLDEANRISQEGMKSYNYYNNRNNFDPGNRIFGTNSVADATIGATADKYIDLYNNNSEAPPVLKQENGELYVLRLPDIKEGLNPVGTVVRGLYGQEAYGVIKDMDFTGSPKVGEYYKLKQREGDFIDKYVEPLAFAALSIVNPAMGAFAAGSKVASEGGDLGDIAKAAAGAYIGGQAAAGGGMFSGVGQALAPTNAALASGISAGVASGVSTAVQGGDLGDVVKNGMLGGVGGYVSGLGTEAASLEQAAQAANAAGDISSAASLAAQANELTQQAGLIGTIANSAKAIDAAIDGDYVTALTSGLNAAGTDLTKFTSDKITGLFGEEALVNLNVDDIAAGVNKVATSLLDGKDFDDALKEGVKEYIQEGGSLGGAGDKVKDYLVSAGEGLYNDIIKPAGDFLTGLVDNVQSFDTPESIKAIEDVVRQAGSAIDDTVLQPIKETAEAIYEPIETPESVKAVEDIVRTAGSTIDDTVLQPIKEVAEAIYEPIETPESVKAIEDAARTAGSAVDDAVIQPIRETLKDIDLPSVSAPNINIDLSGMFDALMAYLPSQQQQRQPVMTQQPIDPVLADLSKYQVEFAQPEEMLASRDYLSGLLRTI